jgi:hypothetical protein
MKRRVLLPGVVLVVLALGAGVGVAAIQTTAATTPWQATFVPCNPTICGGFAQNTAALGLEQGRVSVGEDGVVRITIINLTDLATGAVAARQTLEVHVGSFNAGRFEDAIPTPGTITTDDHGNFSGTIDSVSGVPFAFTPGTTISAQFVLNEAGIRSDFVTGFTVR